MVQRKGRNGYTFLQQKQSWGRCILPNGAQMHRAHIQYKIAFSGLYQHFS